MSTPTKGQTYWKSLNELAQTKEYNHFLHREFPENASEMTDGQTRRHFLKIMGASIALAGLAACRKPVQKILPYTKRPVEIIPGNPIYYASAMPFQGSLVGLLVESNEGRPTKIEGNPDHPASLGGTSIHHQSSILSLYDPDRARKIKKDGEISSKEDFINFVNAELGTNKNILFISEANSSQTLSSLKKKISRKFKKSEWFTYEPFNKANIELGNEIAFGRRLRTINHFDKAKLIVSVDDNFLQDPVNGVAYSKAFAKNRKLSSSKDELNRLYVIESNLSLTGSNADTRYQVKSSDHDAFLYSLAAELSKKVTGLNAYSAYNSKFNDTEWITTLVNELTSFNGNAILTGGSSLSIEANACIALINKALGNSNKTITYVQSESTGETSEEFAKTVSSISNYDAVVFVGGNPAYTSPASVDLSSALSGKTTIHLTDYENETTKLCNWSIPRSHFLEAWGDGKSFYGHDSVIQPLIQPLFESMSEIEFVNVLATGKFESGYKLVRSTWNSVTRTDKAWENLIHDGILDKNGTYKAVSVSKSRSADNKLSRVASSTIVSSDSDIEVVIKPDAKLFDGRFANNGWLQELPDQITKITWDNVALMSAKTATALGIKLPNRDLPLSEADTSASYDNDVPFITVKTDLGTIEIPAWPLPGHVDNSITITTGYGRKGVGRVASQYEFDDFDVVGFNAQPIQNESGLIKKATVQKLDKTYQIACVQDHHSMEGRAIVRFANQDEYKKKPTFAPDMVKTPGVKEGKKYADPLFTPQTYPDYEPQWGMAIDLTSCTGCGVCTIACQAENNIPVVGKREVSRGREMHWIRVDRYFTGEEDNPGVVYQPLPCMHCELAPCEQVCPVAATTHSDDGLNQMTYNRCIGTRYCANNCPYKVRKFNFFNYAKEHLTNVDDKEIVRMAMNPDVTIRFRGVMEKCTYCVQRINRAKIDTKNKTGNSVKPADGTVVTACQQACPSDAIYFGDMTDPNSAVSKMKENERNYRLLDELNTRPRTSYLAKITNKNKDLVTA